MNITSQSRYKAEGGANSLRGMGFAIASMTNLYDREVQIACLGADVQR